LATVTSIALKAYAASACNSCTVTDFYIPPSATNWVWIGTGVNMGSSCGSSGYLAVKMDTDVGKAFFALAQTAHLTGKIVDLTGSGSCTGTGGAEIMSSIWVKP